MIGKWGVVLIVVLCAQACSKKDKDCPVVTYQAPAAEVANLKAYLQANNITATEDTRGFFYIITNPGSGTKPSACKNVTVNYEGKLTNGTTFDSNNNTKLDLGSLIIGWQEGVPLIGAGGSIMLYLPPSLGYGAAGSGPIPANANLVFKIDLLSLNN